MKQVVRTFLQNAEGKYLLVKHQNTSQWTLPGGHIEKGETLYKALKRELLEEFGIKILISGEKDSFHMENIKEYPLPLSVYKIEYVNNNGKHIKKMEYIFRSEILDDSGFAVDSHEIRDYKWFHRDEILEESDIFEQTKLLIQKI